MQKIYVLKPLVARTHSNIVLDSKVRAVFTLNSMFIQGVEVFLRVLRVVVKCV